MLRQVKSADETIKEAIAHELTEPYSERATHLVSALPSPHRERGFEDIEKARACAIAFQAMDDRPKHLRKK